MNELQRLDTHITGNYGEDMYAYQPEDDCEAFTDSTEPDEDSITTGDWKHFYLYGKLAFTIEDEPEDMNAAIRNGLDSIRFYPDVYWISDHGNAHRINYTEGEGDASN